MTWHIANEVGNKAVYAATETTRGTAATPDYQWLGDLTITKTQDLVTTEEHTGGFDRHATPRLGIPSFAGTYAEDLTFESLPMQMQYAIDNLATGVSDGNTTPGYVYVYEPEFDRDTLASATLVYGIDGLAWRSAGVMHDEFTITIDPDDADGVWKFSSTLFVGGKEALPTVTEGVVTSATATTVTETGAAWTVDQFAGQYLFMDAGSHAGEVRLIASNTADTLTVDEAFDTTPSGGEVFRIEANLPVIAAPSYEAIPSYGTKFYIDDASGTLGTTQVLDRIISFNLTVQSQRTTKRFLETARDEVSRRSGRGARLITGQIRAELDRRDEYLAWETLKEVGIRVVQTGSEIDGTAGSTKEAYIEIPRAAFSTPTEDARENNMTVTVPFRAYLPDSDPILSIGAVNELSVLP